MTQYLCRERCVSIGCRQQFGVSFSPFQVGSVIFPARGLEEAIVTAADCSGSVRFYSIFRGELQNSALRCFETLFIRRKKQVVLFSLGAEQQRANHPVQCLKVLKTNEE